MSDKMQNPDLENWSQDGPICPHCGHQHDPADSPDTYYDEGGGEAQCDSCGRMFIGVAARGPGWVECREMQQLIDSSGGGRTAPTVSQCRSLVAQWVDRKRNEAP